MHFLPQRHYLCNMKEHLSGKHVPCIEHNTTFVSFIIIHNNTPRKLFRECIESIFTLSLSDCEKEIIVVDDGSDICPLDYIHEYSNDIIYIRQKSKGSGYAKNIGLDICKGKYIQFINSNDKLIKMSYEHCLDIIRYGEDVDTVIFNLSYNNAAEPTFNKDINITGIEFMQHNDLRSTTCGYIFRRLLLGKLRFNPYLLHEDEDFTPRLILKAEHIITTDIKACFCRNDISKNITGDDKRNNIKQLNDTEQIIFDLANLANNLQHRERIALQRKINKLTMDYICDIVSLTHSKKQLEQRIAILEAKGLFPLPQKGNALKYRFIRQLTRNKSSRLLLFWLLKNHRL